MMFPTNNDNELSHFTAHLFRENSGKMIAVLSKRFGIDKIDDVTDVVQDSFEAALTKWKYGNLPENPSAWLMQVAKNKMINKLKAANHQRVTLTDHFYGIDISSEPTETEIADSQLRLLFFFCKLELSPKKKILLTLYFLCGFGYAEIANALLMQEEAVKKTITRSKELLKSFHSTLEDENLLSQIHQEELYLILYLMFNEGYKTTRSANGLNTDLCYEAIRLTKLILSENNYAEAGALLALMFFNVARFPARIDEEKSWIPLKEQNRELWNKELILEGFYYLDLVQKKTTALNSYYLEALIASIHCSHSSYEQTDWRKIAFLYHQLEKLKPSSGTVVLNRMMAESHYEPASSLIQQIGERESFFMKGNPYLLYLCKAYLFQKDNQIHAALHFYQMALNLVKSVMDEKYIRLQMKKLLDTGSHSN
ncbi:RNA polymerase sigma factor [Gynurincola endophyticus]|uniref:RNA polymerase sigma factor n=1 Tax=Gynurincola endophyticus TaxID=2479004 RepID=UPI000F8DB072|nr:sigma-70 family RNA polymerase sigma factor [Gynurincola endophyticus]